MPAGVSSRAIGPRGGGSEELRAKTEIGPAAGPVVA